MYDLKFIYDNTYLPSPTLLNSHPLMQLSSSFLFILFIVHHNSHKEVDDYGIRTNSNLFNKTGKYIGEITGIYPDHYVVRTLAVLKHPMQGDLHHPKETDVAFFTKEKL